MEHKGTVRLETERLILRKLEVSDAQSMYKNWANSATVTKFMTWLPHENESVTKTVINSWIEQYANSNFYQWAIVLKDINEPIGSISVVRIDERVDECEIGYCIGEKWWGNGYTAEAFRKVIEFLFGEVKANRISAKHDINNPNSGKVMVKCGLEKEGVLRRAFKGNQGICDVALYSIIRK